MSYNYPVKKLSKEQIEKLEKNIFGYGNLLLFAYKCGVHRITIYKARKGGYLMEHIYDKIIKHLD